MERGQKHNRLKRAASILLLVGAPAACQLEQTAVIPTATVTALAPTATSSPIPSPTSSATPQPTATKTPRPTNTPLPPVTFTDAAAQSAYHIPLTVQQLNPLEALVHFELDQPTEGWLLFQPAEPGDEFWWTYPLAADSVSHQVPLVGLTPGTKYRVQVGLGEDLESLRVPRLFGSQWGPITFQAPGLAEPVLRFGVVGDSGFGDDQTKELVDRMHGYDLDFVLHTGDVVYNAHQESGPAHAFAEKYFKIFKPLLAEGPIYPVLGNHEYDGAARFEGRPFFVRAFPSLTDPSVPDDALGTWYAFERSGVQFLMLDTQAFFGAGGRAEQTTWLEERLADPSYRFSIPVIHVAPYTSGRHRNDGAAIRSEWIPLFVEAGVPVVFSGHDHNYERIERDGLTYIVTGGGSPVLYHETGLIEGSMDFHRRMHFVLVEVFESYIALTAIDRDGSELDRTTIPLG